MLETSCYQTASATEFKTITVGNMNYQRPKKNIFSNDKKRAEYTIPYLPLFLVYTIVFWEICESKNACTRQREYGLTDKIFC